ncbi:hypothetical protein LTS02_008230 [Friedmanniomyces endolithicus]|nr:hypothetical protein LTS02_008230 [Friedmanniomyces endolithicus]
MWSWWGVAHQSDLITQLPDVIASASHAWKTPVEADRSRMGKQDDVCVESRRKREASRERKTRLLAADLAPRDIRIRSLGMTECPPLQTSMLV